LKRYIILATLAATSSLTLFAQHYGNLEFIENKGQWDSRAKFMGAVNGGAFFIRNSGFTVLQHNPDDLTAIYAMMHHHGDGNRKSPDDEIVLRSHSYNVDFVNASSSVKIVPDKPLPTYNNYFIGGDPSKWASYCRIYQAVTLENIYPNVDVRYYTDHGILKYDIIAKPGADISRIALRYEGADKLELKNKDLLIKTTVGSQRETIPYTYQTDTRGRRDLSCRYVVKDNIIRFDIKNYDPSATLVIDPTLIFSSYSGSQANNWGYTATYGPDGSMFGGGIVFGTGFPVSPGAFQTTYGGGTGNHPVDIGIIKLTPNGANRVFATYIGGSGNEQPHSLIVDPQGNCILAGRTNSPRIDGNPDRAYPVTGGAAGLIGSCLGYDIVVTKLNATGTALIGSKRIGGSNNDGANISPDRNGPVSLQQNYGDDGRSEVIIDAEGNIYVASCSQSGSSDPASKFPVTPGAFQQNFGGGVQDGVVLKFNSTLSTLLFASFLGGNGNDAAYVLSLGANGNIYVAGGTESTNFPGNMSGVISNTNSGGIDGFVAVISNNGSTLLRSTYIGTAGIDQVYGIQFDRNGFPYVMGQTTGIWQPINAAYSNPGGKQFIAKLQPDLSAYVYLTFFGTNSAIPNISPVAFLVDRCENVYVSGWGGVFDPNRPFYYPTAGTSGLPVTADALKPTSPDNADFYFFVLKRDAVSQLYGSFFGQNGGWIDHVDGGTSRFDQNGVIYQAICANCGGGATFPTTPGAWSTTHNANVANCNLAMVKIEFNLAGVKSGVQSSINGVIRDTAGCVPLTVDFTDTVRNAQSYVWNFGDGSPQVTGPSPNVSHTYNAIGTYQVMLIAIDSASCNIRDTSYMHIRVGDLRATLAMNAIKLAPCDSFRYQFNNLSTTPPGFPFNAQSFQWDFGDGSPLVTAGTNSVFHNYAAPGTYLVKMILVDTTYCNSPDTFTLQLSVAALVKAQFTTPPTGCAPYTAVFTNTSLAGQTFQWDFGDGNTSTAVSPTHLYPNPGTYTITLIANDPNTCNITDTTRMTITVYSLPVADFSFSPDPPLENTPTTFTNLSSLDAVLFRWNFGDGDTLRTTSRLPVQHQYNRTGTFNACLTAINANGCADTICKPVQALIFPLVDVPNAFTPRSGDVNSRVMVRGFGIVKIRFIIWNRWGQKVFETADQNQGWDGKFKGVLQPMDVYAYSLDIEFFDGTKATKKGDITLIR
jgi:gliding motility-associated-like protein